MHLSTTAQQRQFPFAAPAADDLDSLLQPLIDRQPEAPSEIEMQRLRECLAPFAADAVRHAVRRHLEEFSGGTFFISRTFLQREAEGFQLCEVAT